VGCDIAISIANVQSGRASILARQHDADLPTVTRRSTVKLWGEAVGRGTPRRAMCVMGISAVQMPCDFTQQAEGLVQSFSEISPTAHVVLH